MMEWFYQIPGVDELRRAEVPLQNRLEDNDRAPWLLARRLLAESYQQQFQESGT